MLLGTRKTLMVPKVINGNYAQEVSPIVVKEL